MWISFNYMSEKNSINDDWSDIQIIVSVRRKFKSLKSQTSYIEIIKDLIVCYLSQKHAFTRELLKLEEFGLHFCLKHDSVLTDNLSEIMERLNDEVYNENYQIW